MRSTKPRSEFRGHHTHLRGKERRIGAAREDLHPRANRTTIEDGVPRVLLTHCILISKSSEGSNSLPRTPWLIPLFTRLQARRFSGFS
jgi:hypothetical protein